MFITKSYKYKIDGIIYVSGEIPNNCEILETMIILNAEQGKVLKNKINGEETLSAWIKDDNEKDNWDEIDEPIIEEEPIEEIIDGEVIDEN